MSKVISFSISDRYLDKIRSLYPDLTENLAAKQFLIDQLDASLDVSLDNNLDDKLRILIEKSLGDRLDATEKSISKWLLDFDNRINDIDREMKDRSIAIDHQIKAIEARLDENLDTNLDANLDDSLDSSLYESYSEIFNDSPDESLDKSLDTKLNTKVDTNLAVIMDKRYPLSIITLIASTIKAIEARLYENLDTNLDTNLDDSLESYSEIFNDRPDESLDDNLDTKLDDSKEPVTLEEILLRKKAIREEWQTLKEILDQGRKDLPKSIEGLRKKAIREGWPRRDRENRKEYQIPVTK